MDTKKLELQLDTWRRDLIDLSRRNSLLNLSGRAASLSLVEPGFEQMLLMSLASVSTFVRLQLWRNTHTPNNEAGGRSNRKPNL